MNLEKLAERVERATGPDHQLDAEITIACYGFPEKAYHQRNGMRPKGSPDLDRMAFIKEGWTYRFTSSIDEAMKLVPEGWSWALLSDHGKPAKAGLQRTGPDSFAAAESEAATPALALTAACLRARASASAKYPPPSQEAA